jgi:hypothetical protein
MVVSSKVLAGPNHTLQVLHKLFGQLRPNLRQAAGRARGMTQLQQKAAHMVHNKQAIAMLSRSPTVQKNNLN